MNFILFVNEEIDYNLAFRLLYWRDALLSLGSGFELFLGNQVGVMYSSDDFVASLVDYFGHLNGLDERSERYLMAFHNSFLTVAFHYGFIGILLLFYPLISVLSFLWSLKYEPEYDVLIVLLAVLFGILIWCYFNVILELPHSSGFVWFMIFSIYFTKRIKYEK